MNIRFFFPLFSLLPLALIGCAHDSKAPATSADAPTSAPAEGVDAKTLSTTLTANRWTLESATDAQGKRLDALFPDAKHTLTLSFENGRAAVAGGCNSMGGGYALDTQNTVTISQLASTRKACEPALMQADQAIGALLAKPLQAKIDTATPLRMHLASPSGETSIWVGEPTATTRYGGAGETMFLEIAPARVTCPHAMIPNYQCLQVREIRYDAQGIKQSPPGEWQFLYENIEGFEFREGERKVLRLKKFKRNPAPADASSIAYVLDMVVESEIVKPQSK
ncbi:putative lipoprotein [Labilithrix luteola]|uniref:Putative lipoprotein n=1 Tax=Labilithrix luteola TaxID=1391654 RepID=A0A0K1Q7R9_9BACT|nr:META and DUF4377 domain-containing protein [Labilithrix luteola]AKV01455.1 putative lipoprotein [Labilithrix luteola]